MILFNKSSFSGTSQGEPAKTSLWMIDPDGGEPIQIQTRIETEARQVHAFMSKNCTRMAVPDDTRYGGDNRPYTMDLMNLDGSNRSSISVPGFTKLTPTWSQDGSMLAYISRDQSAAGTRSTSAGGTRSQAILNILDGSGAQLRSFSLAVYPMGDTPWSPDKSHLVFVAEVENSVNVRDIYIVDTETGQLRNVTHDKAAGVERITERPWAPAWSPDSQKLAYIDSSLDYGNSIRLLDLSTGSDTLVWSPDRNWRNSSLGGVAWSPDGSHIAFSTSWDEPDQLIGNHMEDLWLMRSDGSEAHILYQGPDIDKLAGWCLCDDFPSVLGVPEGSP
jgi:Tol biopolymer transport system component